MNRIWIWCTAERVQALGTAVIALVTVWTLFFTTAGRDGGGGSRHVTTGRRVLRRRLTRPGTQFCARCADGGVREIGQIRTNDDGD